MRLSWKLALAYAGHHPLRMVLTLLAMIASACIVVWVVSGYDALAAKFGSQAAEYLGRFDLFVVPDQGKDRLVAAELIEALRQDAAVAEVEPVMQLPARVAKPDVALEVSSSGDLGDGERSPGRGPGGGARAGAGPGGGGRSGAGPGGGGRPGAGPRGGPGRMMVMPPSLVGTHAEQPPYALLEGRWIDLQHPDRREAVLSNVTAQQLQIKVGDDLLLILGPKEYRLTIIGIVEQVSAQMPMGPPGARGGGQGPATAAVYVPLELAEKLTRQPAQINLVSLKLKPEIALEAFRRGWTPRLAQFTPPARMLGIDEIKAGLEEGMMAANARRQAWAATGMALLAALFIIFTTLSMGVTERVRQFALMRAVGLTRRQVAGVIAVEGLLFGLLGWGGGLAAGKGLLMAAARVQPDLFPSGVTLGLGCIVFTGLSALGGALLASLVPAWQATRVRPLEAMTPRPWNAARLRGPLLAGLVGLVLVAVNPVLVFWMPIPDAVRYGIYEAVGCTSMAIGFLLLTPLCILTVERLLGPGLAWLLALDPRLLKAQLSSNLGRTVGTTAALTVGLGLYVALLVWGYSMLQPFLPGKWVPDLLVSFQRGGIPDAEMEAVRQVRGVVAEQCLPLAVEQPRLGDDLTGSHDRQSVTRQDSIVLVGVDPQAAFGGARPVLDVEFTQGTRAEVLARLEQEHACLVPDYFIAATGLKVGDRFRLIPPESPEERVEYTIAGVIALPGSHFMTKFSGMRRRDGRMAAMVFARLDDVRRDFDLKEFNFLWMNLDPNVPVEEIAAGLRPIADRHLGPQQPVNQQGTWTNRAMVMGPSLRLSSRAQVYGDLRGRAEPIIWAMCQLPLITLLVTALGVINTVVASVRARRWELGVLRAVGTSRGALMRMILAEGLLIGLVTCLVSLAFGLLAGWCGMGISQYVSFFGGLNPGLVVPWAKVALGVAATLGLCLAAALGPALATGRAEPLRLLQQGRTAW